MKTLHLQPDGVACRAAATLEGWLAAVLVLPDPDRDCVAVLDSRRFQLHRDEDFPRWSETVQRAERRLVALQCGPAGVKETEIARAPHIAFTICGGDRPVILWTENGGGQWRLKLWSPAEGECSLAGGAGWLDAPAVCRSEGHLWVAGTLSAEGRTRTVIWDELGKPAAQVEGRRPRLTALPEGGALLLVERADSGGIGQQVFRWEKGALRALGTLPRVGDLNLNPSVIPSPDGRLLWLAWEACPKWGWDERVELHRDLAFFVFDPRDGRFHPGPGTANGVLPLDRPGFFDRSPFNGVSVRPEMFTLAGEAAVAFRRFRPVGSKGFGWDVLFIRHGAEGWTVPVRVSPHAGPPDGGYTVLGGQETTLFMPCCTQHPISLWSDPAPDEFRNVRAAMDWRVEIVAHAPGEALPVIGAPEHLKAAYVIPPGVASPAPEPPPLPDAPRGLALYWGDFHTHTAYSKCMSANDGTPLDMLRYQRDLLGCRILCLTDHMEYMSAPEFLHVIDSVLAEAGTDCVPIFGAEYARPPAHHINFYAADRETFLRLRCILMAEADSRRAYERVKKELPLDRVMAIRHFHGRTADTEPEFGSDAPRVTELHDPALEPAMEAMQMRGNMLTDSYAGLPLFPTNYLNAGARIGLIGGSDHCRGFDFARNSFCMTGLWLAELSASAVFAAIRRRQTLACANGKIALWLTTEGGGMGDEIAATTPVRLRVHAGSARPVRKLTLLRDGLPVAAESADALLVSCDLADPEPAARPHWYVVKAEAAGSLDRRPAVAFSSPVFVRNQR